MTDYMTHLRKDKVFGKIVTEPLPPLVKAKNPFNELVASIICQQLSVKAARVIHGRFIDLHGGKYPAPKKVLLTAHNDLRNVGMSNSKAQYVKNVAAFAVENGMTLRQLNKMQDEEVQAYLTQIKGVGRWTVEMLMMFHLDRPDVFSIDDLGIQQAMAALYKWDTTDKKKLKVQMLKTSARWQPYRSYACRYLWRWKDMKLKDKKM